MAPARSSRWLKLILMAISGLLALLVLSQLPIQAYLQQALAWVQSLGSWGAIAFVLIYALATVLFLPGSLLTLGGGALFGLVWGTVWVFSGAMLGATLAFLVGRYGARAWVQQKIAGNTQFQAIDAAVAQQGKKIVLLTRLSPVFPFNLLNYAFGLTQVSLFDYVVGSLGMFPGTVMYVYIGSLAGSLASLGAASQSNIPPAAQQLRLGLQILGLVATVGVTLYITRIARKALDESVAAATLEATDPD
jgi:uncharacterized membrane protein YdjX (TVP38/TMEM64 family)